MSEQNQEFRPESGKNTPNEEKEQAVDLVETSPALRKLDNFWYHNKWTVIVSVFFVSVLVVCVVQLFLRPQYDTSIAIATRYRMNSAQHAAFEDTVTRLIPGDFNGDGKKLLNITVFEYYSEAEIEDAREEYARPDANGETDHFQINGAYNKSEYDSFNQFTLTGETSVYIVSPSLYKRLLDNDRLMPLAELYPDGKLPDGARDDGCGVDLKDTDLYKYNPALQVLPEDSILCLHRPTLGGKSSHEEDYANEKAFFHALADLRIED